MHLLVTGGAGFIGSNFIRHMLNSSPDWRITNLDKLTYAGNLESTRDFGKNPMYKFVKGDICDAKAVRSAAADANAIINFAAESHVDRSIIEAGEFVRTDVLGTHILLEEARKSDCTLLHISTDEVYGSIKTGSFRETGPLLPNSPYSASKAGAEMLVRAYRETYGLKTLVTRSSNNYGPYQHPEKLIPHFITNLLRGKKVPLYGAGKNVRDWLYVGDNCEAIELVLRKGKAGEIYNAGSGEEKTNLEITKSLLSLARKNESSIEYVPDRPGHDFRYSMDCSKIRKLGWRPKTKFKGGIRSTFNWYSKNRWWWEKLT